VGNAPVISNDQRVDRAFNLSRARVAVLSFAGAPDHPETGRFAQELATGLLVQNYSVSIASPSKVQAYERDHNVVLSEYDIEILRKILHELSVDIVVWGTVNQFSPYKFDRMAPATPPYVEITLYGFRQEHTTVSRVSGRKQGGLPATIYSRQPTFEDVAQPLMVQLLSRMN